MLGLGGVVIDRTFGSAELFGRTSTVRFGPNDCFLFSAEHRTFFFVLHSMASFHIFILLDDPHVCGVIIGLQVKQPKLFVCLLDLGFTPN